jgi:hypothetical protein
MQQSLGFADQVGGEVAHSRTPCRRLDAAEGSPRSERQPGIGVRDQVRAAGGSAGASSLPVRPTSGRPRAHRRGRGDAGCGHRRDRAALHRNCRANARVHLGRGADHHPGVHRGDRRQPDRHGGPSAEQLEEHDGGGGGCVRPLGDAVLRRVLVDGWSDSRRPDHGVPGRAKRGRQAQTTASVRPSGRARPGRDSAVRRVPAGRVRSQTPRPTGLPRPDNGHRYTAAIGGRGPAGRGERRTGTRATRGRLSSIARCDESRGRSPLDGPHQGAPSAHQNADPSRPHHQ